jgi:hypothetical protein
MAVNILHFAFFNFHQSLEQAPFVNRAARVNLANSNLALQDISKRQICGGPRFACNLPSLGQQRQT